MNQTTKLRNMTSIYLSCGDKMLLLYRQGGRVVNNVWVSSAGGHFEESELNDPETCVLRELEEELSITEDMLEGLQLRYVTLRRIKGEIRQNYYYFAELPGGTEMSLSSDEGELKWVSMPDMLQLEMPFTAKCMLEHYLEIGREKDIIYGGIADGTKVVFTEMPDFGAYPTRTEAEKILQEAEGCNPGPWGNHSRIAASCAEKIALLCDDMDSEKAYVVGLLHDIGRKFGVKHLGHVYDGYHYMRDLGYGDVARICLTHSFSITDLSCYIGNRDIPTEQQEEINTLLHSTTYDDYDLLIQLCDALAGAEGVLDMEERMADVKRRYGSYPQEKWERNLYLRKYFEEKTGRDLYEIVRQ